MLFKISLLSTAKVARVVVFIIIVNVPVVNVPVVQKSTVTLITVIAAAKTGVQTIKAAGLEILDERIIGGIRTLVEKRASIRPICLGPNSIRG
jgi:hypothetical protein